MIGKNEALFVSGNNQVVKLKNLQQNPWNWLIYPLFSYKTQLFFWSTASTSTLKVAFFAQKLKKLSQPRVLL
jgi:hypothetical protein